MITGFQQQRPLADCPFPQAAPAPQHGQKPDQLCKQIKERRSFRPAPGR